jgi:hypothetical protein
MDANNTGDKIGDEASRGPPPNAIAKAADNASPAKARRIDPKKARALLLLETVSNGPWIEK